MRMEPSIKALDEAMRVFEASEGNGFAERTRMKRALDTAYRIDDLLPAEAFCALSNTEFTVVDAPPDVEQEIIHLRNDRDLLQTTVEKQAFMIREMNSEKEMLVRTIDQLSKTVDNDGEVIRVLENKITILEGESDVDRVDTTEIARQLVAAEEGLQKFAVVVEGMLYLKRQNDNGPVEDRAAYIERYEELWVEARRLLHEHWKAR